MPLMLSAQKYEFGLEGGLSADGRPAGNMYYKGEKIDGNYSFRAQFLSNMSKNFQIGIELETFELSRLTAKTYLTPMADGTISGDGQRLIYSEVTPTLCGVLNKKIRFHHGYFFGGIAAGAGTIVNPYKTGSSEYLGPSGGVGPCLGLQIGFIRNITKRIAFNATAALRYYDLYYTAHAPNYTPYSYLHYEITSYSVNVGFRYLIPRRDHAPIAAPTVLQPQTQPIIQTQPTIIINSVKDTIYVRDSIFIINESHVSLSTQSRGNATVIMENTPDQFEGDNSDPVVSNKISKHKIKQHFERNAKTGDSATYWILAGLYGNKSESEKALERVQREFREPSSVIQLGMDYGVLIKEINTKADLFNYLAKLNNLGYSEAIDW